MRAYVGAHQDVEGIEIGDRPVVIDEDLDHFFLRVVAVVAFLRVDVFFTGPSAFAGALRALAVFFGLAAGLAAGAAAAFLRATGFAFAFVITANIFAIGRVSGCHINPAITISLALSKRFPWAQAVPYIIAQYAGAILGGFLIFAVFLPDKATMNLGVTSYASGHAMQGFLAEALGTFILMLAVMGSAVDRRAPPG